MPILSEKHPTAHESFEQYFTESYFSDSYGQQVS